MNGIIIVDKPAGWTSQDVCSKLRGVLHERRIGHSGTLDPMATGVLPVFCGRATRAVEFAESDEKHYIAGLRCGMTTDTQDITGTILEQHDGGEISDSDLIAVLPAFLGCIQQIPPMYSAIKINGKKLYELARRGKTVERKPREITIKHIELLGRDGGDFIIDVICSKGTYIRTLCADIGEKLGCGAVMSSLQRISAGSFSIHMSHTMDDIIKTADEGRADELILPVDSMFSGFPALTINAAQEMKCRNGNSFSVPGTADGSYRVYSADGGFLMLGKSSGGEMNTVKSFFNI